MYNLSYIDNVRRYGAKAYKSMEALLDEENKRMKDTIQRVNKVFKGTFEKEDLGSVEENGIDEIVAMENVGDY